MEMAGWAHEWSRGQTASPPVATYLPFIQLYFPPSQQANATSILGQILSDNATVCPDPSVCVTELPSVLCRSAESPSSASGYGLFQIADSCWNPELAGTSTPFEPFEWAQVLDPQFNTWMASVVYSINGWRAWSQCEPVGICLVPGGPIPYPRSPDPFAGVAELDAFLMFTVFFGLFYFGGLWYVDTHRV